MNRKGNYWDNAVSESFFGTLKTEHTNHETYKNIREAKMNLFRYIEGFYNHNRRHSMLGNVSPSQFEEKTTYPCPFYRVQVNASTINLVKSV